MRGIRVAVVLVAALVMGVLGAGAAAAGTTVGYWHMDERAGATTMVDATAYGNHGALRNVLTGQTGAAGYSYYFQPNSIATVPNSASLNPGSRDFTLTENIRTNARVTNWNVTQKGYSVSPGGQYKIEIRHRGGGAAGQVACVFRGSVGKVVLVNGPDVTDDRWHHIVCAKHATSVALQVDFGTIYRAYRTVGSISNTEPLTIGSKAPGDDQYIGRIDEVGLVVA